MLNVRMVDIEKVVPYARNPRRNDGAVAAVAASIKEFGFRQPIVVDEEMVVLAGHTRLKAARSLGMDKVPVHVAVGLTPAQRKAFRIADNRTSELAEWDRDMLALELEDLRAEDFDLGVLAPDIEIDGGDVGTEDAGGHFEESFSIIVVCSGEADQREKYDRLVADGYECKVLVN